MPVKGFLYKIKECLRRGFRVERKTLCWSWNRFWYAGSRGYAAKRFWRDRHRCYGFDMRGVGWSDLSHEENLIFHGKGKAVFLNLCREEQIDFQKVRLLDIGCGTGYYAEVFLEQGGTDYTGVDITEELFDRLRKKYPNFVFREIGKSGEGNVVVVLHAVLRWKGAVKTRRCIHSSPNPAGVSRPAKKKRGGVPDPPRTRR